MSHPKSGHAKIEQLEDLVSRLKFDINMNNMLVVMPVAFNYSTVLQCGHKKKASSRVGIERY